MRTQLHTNRGTDGHQLSFGCQSSRFSSFRRSIIGTSSISTIAAVGFGLAALGFGIQSCGSSSSPAAPSEYVVSPLVSNIAGLGASVVDSNLKNPWGLAVGTAGAFWIADNGSGVSSHYDSTGAIKTKAIPVAKPGGLAAPTGIVFNTTATSFAIPGTGPSSYIYATEDGTLNALGFGSDSAVALSTSRMGNSVFKGLEIGSNNGTPMLYAADFKNGTVDLFDGNYALLQQVLDPQGLTGFAPFNVKLINDKLFVTYAKQNGIDDQPGVGNGFIDIFNQDGTFNKRFATNDSLNSPWGMALVTSNFGDNNGRLLVGNFGDGKISIYNVDDGSFQGLLKDANGNDVVIPGLWSLTFYDGILYYTAGPNDEQNGVFGKITLK